ncbi:MAG: iron ABC transporter permease [Thermosynechococcaceae cyanobacterium MS004]|nr:iron ABC transporter permease [Thermosynechococcaceae cyanobacterium MS004]
MKSSQNALVNAQMGLVLILIAILLMLFCLSLATGSVSIPLQDVVTVLQGQSPQKASWSAIILQFRLPKAITAMLAGSALAVSGLQMQTLFQNPLAGPYVLGVSSGASLGVALAVLATTVMGAQRIALTGSGTTIIAALLGAAGVMGCVVIAANYVKNSVTLLVIGLLFGYLTSAVVNLLLYFSVPEQIQTYLIWTFGSFATVTQRQLPLFLGLVLTGLAIAFSQSKSLNLLLLGETQARTLGLTLSRVRLLMIGNVSLLAGTVTAFCGPIAFLGIAVPHLGRSLLRSTDHRRLMPVVVLLGAILALIADLVSQLPGRQTILPLNSITALIGTPIVVWIIVRRQSHR